MRGIVGLLAIGFLIAAWAWPATPHAQMSAEQLLRYLADLQAVDTSDAEMAAELENIVLTTRFPAEAILVLQRPELGPMAPGTFSLAALKALVVRSASLGAPTEPIMTLDSPPDDPMREEMLQRITSFASNYVHGLPRFTCLETTRYSSSGHLPKRGKSSSSDDNRPADWRLDQKIAEEVRYLDGAEEYRTKSINDQPSTAPIVDVRSSYSRGEFGTIISETFDPAMQASFDWDHWETVQGKRMAAWRFTVEREHSQYMICCISTGSVTVRGVRHEQRKTWVSAYRGLIYADPDSGAFRRFVYQTVDIPSGYDLDDARTFLDFEYVTLKKSAAWLPRRAVHYTRQQAYRTRSQIDFSDYHSFETDSSLEFPTDDAPPKK